MDEICIDGWIIKDKLRDFLDVYQFLPIKIKKDKNKSSEIYYILSSNKRNAPLTKE